MSFVTVLFKFAATACCYFLLLLAAAVAGLYDSKMLDAFFYVWPENFMPKNFLQLIRSRAQPSYARSAAICVLLM